MIRVPSVIACAAVLAFASVAVAAYHGPGDWAGVAFDTAALVGAGVTGFVVGARLSGRPVSPGPAALIALVGYFVARSVASLLAGSLPDGWLALGAMFASTLVVALTARFPGSNRDP